MSRSCRHDTASAAATSVATANQSRRARGLRRRVEPRREHGEQRERAVGVVQLVGRALVVGEQQQPERDLGDDQRLREREQVRDPPPAPRRRASAINAAGRRREARPR